MKYKSIMAALIIAGASPSVFAFGVAHPNAHKNAQGSGDSAGNLYLMAIEGEKKGSIFRGNITLPGIGEEVRCGVGEECLYNYGLGALSWDDVTSDEYDTAYADTEIIKIERGKGVDAQSDLTVCSTITTGAWRIKDNEGMASRYTLCSAELATSETVTSHLSKEEMGKAADFLGAHSISIEKTPGVSILESNYRPGVFYEIGNQIIQDSHNDISGYENTASLNLAIFEIREIKGIQSDVPVLQ